MSVANATYTRTNLGQQDGSNHPRFFVDQVQDMVASENAGRPIFREEERVEIIMPGNPHTRPVARVSDEHRQRWPREYEAFKAGLEISPDGTPLEEWPILKRSQVMELKALGFKTVEHIRDMDDLAIQRIGMGGRRLKELAGGFLDDADRIANESKLSAENERLTEQVAALTRQVQEMGELTQKTFAELQTMKNTPSPLATHIPGMSDPIGLAARAGHQQQVAASSLDNIGGGSRRERRRAAQSEASHTTNQE
jgi:hypothetical protein